MTWLGPNSTEVGSIDQAECYYKGLNEGFSPYERKQSWWNVFAARLGFVLAFQVRLKHSNLRLFVVGLYLLFPTNDRSKSVRFSIHHTALHRDDRRSHYRSGARCATRCKGSNAS